MYGLYIALFACFFFFCVFTFLVVCSCINVFYFVFNTLI